MLCTTNLVVRSGLLTRSLRPTDKRKVVSPKAAPVSLLYFHSFVNIFPSRFIQFNKHKSLRQFYRQIISRAKYLYNNRTLGPFICPCNLAEYKQEVPQ